MCEQWQTKKKKKLNFLEQPDLIYLKQLSFLHN
jgi:hypothetical protein